jgi:LDH2 family malate/lactate/ureidoglycolate dehydrogenase
MPLNEFTARMGELIDQLKSSQLAAGASGIYLPGEIEYNLKQQRLSDGIPMTTSVIDGINRLAAELGSSHQIAALGG